MNKIGFYHEQKEAPTRPGPDDYNGRNVGPNGGKLDLDMDRRPIKPEVFIAGRSAVGGADEGLLAAGIEEITRRLGVTVAPLDISKSSNRRFAGAFHSG